MASAMTKIGDGPLDGHHLLAKEQHIVVDVIKLIIKSLLNTFKSLPYALLHSPMLSSCDELFISVKDGIVVPAGPRVPLIRDAPVARR